MQLLPFLTPHASVHAMDRGRGASGDGLVYDLEREFALLGLGAFVLSWLISSLGAGLWPGLGEFESLETGRFRALELPRASVHEIDVGPGWSKGGLDVVLLPYVRALNALVGARPVSFFGPDEDGLEVRFALHTFSDDAARTLAGLLRSPRSVEAGERSSPGGGARS